MNATEIATATPVPVATWKPGAHRRDRAGGHIRGWVIRPYGYRAADTRARDKAAWKKEARA